MSLHLSSWSCRWCVLLAVTLALTVSSATRPPTPAEVEAVVREAGRYSISGPRDGVSKLEGLVLQSRPGDSLRHQLELRIATTLAGEVTDDGRRVLCRCLAVIGTDVSLATLERMLLKPETVAVACSALEIFPSKAADNVLRRALDRTDGPARLGIINALGVRRDNKSEPLLAKLAASTNAPTASAAIAALGQIAGFSAADVLERIRRTADPQLRQEIALAQLMCAQRFALDGDQAKASALFVRLFQDEPSILIRRAALIGMVTTSPAPEAAELVLKLLKETDPVLRATAVAQIPLLKDPGATRHIAGYLAKATPEVQALMIAALADRGDQSARPAVETLIRDPSPDVSREAIRAVGRFADAASANALLQVVSAPPSPIHLEAALAALRQLSGTMANEAILRWLKTATGKVRATLIELLADRHATDAVPVLLVEAVSTDPAVARASYKALISLVSPVHLDRLVARLLAITDASLLPDAEAAVIKAASQILKPELRCEAVLGAFAKADRPMIRLSLLRVLGGLGGPKALETVRIATRDGDPATRETALRLLTEWPDAGAIKAQLQIAGDTKDAALRTLMVRGALRLLGEAESIPATDRLAAFRKALELAGKVEEKRLALAALAQSPFDGALDLVTPLVDDSEVNAEACLAGLAIARAQIIAHKQEAQTLLQKISTTAADEKLRNQAAEALKELR